MTSENRRIPLRVSNKKAYVWDVDAHIKKDIAVIRSKYHLCGVLSGTLPHLSQQNVFLGIPLVLLPEEAALLVNIGAAVLIDDPEAHAQPPISDLQEWNAEQQESVKSQLALAESKNAKGSSGAGRALSEEAQRKRKEREERKKAQALLKSEEGSESLLASPSLHSAQTAGPEAGRPNQSSIPYTIVVPAASSTLKWYRPDDAIYETIGQARNAGVWDYPSNLQERARCGVFRGLWEQGYYMGGGIKFGGEYLVYPGDPLRYHSHFVASVLEAPTSTLRPMEIVAHGRLGTATKKSHLLCGWDDEKQAVSYLSIEWAGFG